MTRTTSFWITAASPTDLQPADDLSELDLILQIRICTEAVICLLAEFKFSCLNQLMVNCMVFRFAGSVSVDTLKTRL
jgi:hypothetical protein